MSFGYAAFSSYWTSAGWCSQKARLAASRREVDCSSPRASLKSVAWSDARCGRAAMRPSFRQRFALPALQREWLDILVPVHIEPDPAIRSNNYQTARRLAPGQSRERLSAELDAIGRSLIAVTFVLLIAAANPRTSC